MSIQISRVFQANQLVAILIVNFLSFHSKFPINLISSIYHQPSKKSNKQLSTFQSIVSQQCPSKKWNNEHKQRGRINPLDWSISQRDKDGQTCADEAVHSLRPFAVIAWRSRRVRVCGKEECVPRREHHHQEESNLYNKQH